MDKVKELIQNLIDAIEFTETEENASYIISEQDKVLLNDAMLQINLSLGGVSESFSKKEVEYILFYGQKSEDSKKIDDYGRIDLPIMLMFDFIEERTYINRGAVEKIFWDRISYFLNSR